MDVEGEMMHVEGIVMCVEMTMAVAMGTVCSPAQAVGVGTGSGCGWATHLVGGCREGLLRNHLPLRPCR